MYHEKIWQPCSGKRQTWLNQGLGKTPQDFSDIIPAVVAKQMCARLCRRA
jgi:hypothetical protein